MNGIPIRASVAKITLVLVLACALQACTTVSSVGGGRSSSEKAAEANLKLGAAYLRRGNYKMAVEKLQRALNQNSDLAEAHSAIALAYDKLGETAQAEKHYRKAVRLADDSGAAANSYAVFLCRQDKWKKAEPYFKQAANNPKYSTPAVALTNAGTCAYSAGEVEQAEHYYRAALQKESDYPGALAGLMRLSYKQDKYLETRAFVQRYLAVRPATAEVLWICYNAETRLADNRAANNCATRLKESFPASPQSVQLERIERNAGR